MSAGNVQRVPPTLLLQEELKLLDGLFEGRMRYRVYRHHLFFREADILRRALRKELPHLAEPAVGQRECLLRRLLFLTVRCAETAVLEMSASRVDTISLAALLLAVSSRIGCVLGALSRHTRNEFAEIAVENTKFFIAQKKRCRQKRTRSTGNTILLRHPTIGSVLEVAAAATATSDVDNDI
ncbi:uncharacterized protein TM35_000211080 [Trypanosoma theileri]|uniref:Uncharacterized protein n=1 Tax=Trypanosoma theileri TaxID=67003 RepID=A0A1X0NS20_9TRYP|nr:uncharacterized protein TM35_000211080 [Trypanosoma theileri]ORC87502.1 hypothetical protein TM35_000211080 [Trypanosoma theileri]